jgi:hypothetical protein
VVAAAAVVPVAGAAVAVGVAMRAARALVAVMPGPHSYPPKAIDLPRKVCRVLIDLPFPKRFPPRRKLGRLHRKSPNDRRRYLAVALRRIVQALATLVTGPRPFLSRGPVPALALALVPAKAHDPVSVTGQ